jgi:hypothetical protein
MMTITTKITIMRRIQNYILSFHMSGIYALWPYQAWQESKEEQTMHPSAQRLQVLTPVDEEAAVSGKYPEGQILEHSL